MEPKMDQAADGVWLVTGTAEAPHARAQVIEEASKLQVLQAAWRPQVLGWELRILRACPSQ